MTTKWPKVKLGEDEEEQKLASGEKQPVLAKYISGPIKLRANFKGKMIKASAKKDGLIRYGGKPIPLHH
jgi:hypothetical protein